MGIRKTKLRGSILMTTVMLLSLFLGILYFELQILLSTIDFTKQAKQKEMVELLIEHSRVVASNKKKFSTLNLTFEEGMVVVKKKTNYPMRLEYQVKLANQEDTILYQEYLKNE